MVELFLFGTYPRMYKNCSFVVDWTVCSQRGTERISKGTLGVLSNMALGLDAANIPKESPFRLVVTLTGLQQTVWRRIQGGIAAGMSVYARIGLRSMFDMSKIAFGRSFNTQECIRTGSLASFVPCDNGTSRDTANMRTLWLRLPNEKGTR
jgi:hypothetical protein